MRYEEELCEVSATGRQKRKGWGRAGEGRAVSAVRDEDFNRPARYNVVIIIFDGVPLRILTKKLFGCENIQRCI